MIKKRKIKSTSPFRFPIMVFIIFFTGVILLSLLPGPDEIEENSITYSVSDQHNIRLYRTAEPNNGKIAELQKGAVLVRNGTETVGDGMGFGGVVLKYEGQTYFSKNATLISRKGSAVKTFYFNAVEVGVPDNTTFVNVSTVGEVNVTYTISSYSLHISVNLESIPENSTLIILNEQSGLEYFRYSGDEPNIDKVNFSWKPLKSRNHFLLNANGSGFGIVYTDKMRLAADLFLGREVEPGGFDRAGFDFVIDMNSYKTKNFSYDVRICDDTLMRATM